jgi:hypothetical protein
MIDAIVDIYLEHPERRDPGLARSSSSDRARDMRLVAGADELLGGGNDPVRGKTGEEPLGAAASRDAGGSHWRR